jgi:hypothetical protein
VAEFFTKNQMNATFQHIFFPYLSLTKLANFYQNRCRGFNFYRLNVLRLPCHELPKGRIEKRREEKQPVKFLRRGFSGKDFHLKVDRLLLIFFTNIFPLTTSNKIALEMKKVITLLYQSLVLLLFIFTNVLYSQNPVFTDTIPVGQTFTSDTTIYPFADQSIYGIAASGNVQFNSYTAYVRILITDNNGDQFIIFESYPMIDTAWNFNFNTKCDETCFLNNYQATSINFHVLDATVTLNNLEYTEAPVEGAYQLQYNAKLTNDLDKIDRVNAFLESKQMLWRAGVTEYSNLYYNERIDPYSGLAKYTYGFEYYIGGIFEIYGRSGNWNQPTYNTAPRFDWRSRHGADEENTPYYDGDLNGSGWMTDLRCQTGCWIESTEEWLCIS